MAYRFDFLAVAEYAPVLLKGLGVTVELIAVGAVAGVAIGIACAWAGTQGPRWTRPPVTAYVELVRNTPFLIQLFFIFFGLPSIGVQLNEMQAACLAMAFNLGAYSTEIIRAGIDATPRGQYEAGMSLAMSRMQVFRARRAAAGPGAHLAGAVIADHHRDAGIGGLFADRGGRPILRGELYPVAQLPAFRGLHRHHPHLPAVGHRAAAGAAIGGPAAIRRERAMIEFSFWDIVRNLLLAARWTVVLAAVAFAGGAVLGWPS